MKRILFFITFLSALSFSSCSSTGDIDWPFTLPYYEVNVFEDKFVELGVIAGSGEYTINVEDNTIAEAELISNELYVYGGIKITGKKIGQTKLDITDKERGKTRTVTIHVNEMGVNLEVFHVITEIEMDTVTYARQYNNIKDYVSGHSALTSGDNYLLSNEERGLIYTFVKKEFTKQRRFRNEKSGDEYYIIIRVNEDPDETEASRLRLLAGGNYTAYRSYLNFFYSTPRTRHDEKEPLSELLGLEEDLTPYFRDLYPEADIELVRVTYASYMDFAIFTER